MISHEREVAEESKETLENVETFAELQKDPRASLPPTFTVCATILSVMSNPDPMFFTILGKDRSSWFQAGLNQVSEVSGKRFFYSGNNYGSVDTLPVFPNEWVKSCTALDTVSGWFQWVSRGELVENNTYAGITRNAPTDLTKRIILGAKQNSDGTWTTRS